MRAPATGRPAGVPAIGYTAGKSSTGRSPLIVLMLTLAGWLVVGPGVMLAVAEGSDRVKPLPGEVLREFQVGEQNWLPGHRGVDLAGQAGDPVKAAATGAVSWVGVIDGVPMLTVQHPDGLRTTYQPVEATVQTGQQVAVGQQIGVLSDGHCADQACLHWGVRDGDSYLDPLVWLGSGSDAEIRLLPRSAVPRQQPPPGAFEAAEVLPLTGDMPVPGPLTSEFGSRVNPISGLVEYHDGIDIGAACGTPVQVQRPGTVIFAGVAGGYGNRIEIDHGVIGGVSVQTSYSHLSAIGVAMGQHVDAGAVVGQVGTTGYSTGCHLHYSGVINGALVDPRTIGG
ncbi:peptidoglycan DD-metalloendopeptidase family protein [Propionimicrobium sp. PCR01-08-3]|uniref:peptidoglycan DD-metalloendopeptidase family protein n=1 Tax=Propionimicrobium sp. PCR01-08-3 TaxID=3052086 RepID=UPI00255C8693|nr:peptidoglycan DD-metalloendopeptidase family protein [Propionimicrobium sp. PCR01-08-3]WIY81594.1 peptidoglycan DD-metalloendopeptidase family protein [Propionimicrobium sp. PCR01-08-3]